MRTDLEHLMQEAGLDALMVMGAAMHNPAMAYFVGRAHLTSGELLLRRGEPPLLVHRPMERDEAARTGLRTRDVEDYDPSGLLQQTSGDIGRSVALRYRRMFEEYGVHGRVGLAGRVEAGLLTQVTHQLREVCPDIEIVGAVGPRDVIGKARATKDAEEVERIRRMGKITTSVVADVANLLTSHRVRDGRLVNQQDEVLTIGGVKRRINLWLAMRGADNPEGSIFAQGRDAGVPHSVGADDAPVEVGKPIIFDIFPCEAGGGYFYDFTRTWCVGHATDDVVQAHEDVRAVQRSCLESIRADMLFKEIHLQACQAFEARGHPSVMSSPRTTEGYVHSIGHGVGLAVQESPWSYAQEGNQDRLVAGSVFTVEPGVYYPERGYGVRIEDTVWLRPDGRAEVLADYSTDLVLKVAGA